MSLPFITIVHNENYTCKLLILYTVDMFYYSGDYTFKYLNNFKNPALLKTSEKDIVLYSKNNNHILTINIS